MIYDTIEQQAIISNTINTARTLTINNQRFIRICSGYDTETTRREKHSYIYHFQLGINRKPLGFRTWDTFLNIITYINKCMNKKYRNAKRKPIFLIWVANLSFEFQFLKDRLEWEIFAPKARQPLYINNEYIQFRECLKISGSNLAHLAKTFCKTQKLVGDLDYTIMRNSETPLTEKELLYMENDVIILCEFADYVFKHCTEWGLIPYTSTGILRHECRKNTPKGWESEVKQSYFSESEYKVFMHYLYRGAFVHANRAYANQVLVDVESWDKKSSYPAQMLQQYYPKGHFETVPKFDKSLLDKYACIIDVVFYNITPTTLHSIESGHKIIESENARYDNGRLISADMIHVLLTEIDYKIYCMFYKWEKEKILHCKIAMRGKLPEFLTDLVLKYFTLKEMTPKDTTDYFISKTRVNAFYGMCCTHLHLTEWKYKGGEWVQEKATKKNGDEKTFEDFVEKDFLIPYYGIWITAHARYDLLLNVYQNHHYVVYCDTDSIYFAKGYDKEKLLQHNEKLKAINRAGKQANFEKLGCYEFEGRYKRFKTLGSKRYIKEYYRKDMKKHKYKILYIKKKNKSRLHRTYYLTLNKASQTIAGLGKTAMIEYAHKTHQDIFDIFRPNATILNTFTSKLTTHYEDTPHSDIIDGELMQELSSVSLMPSDFKMYLPPEYLQLILLTRGER